MEYWGMTRAGALPRLEHAARPLQLDPGVEGERRPATSTNGLQPINVIITDVHEHA